MFDEALKTIARHQSYIVKQREESKRYLLNVSKDTYVQILLHNYTPEAQIISLTLSVISDNNKFGKPYKLNSSLKQNENLETNLLYLLRQVVKCYTQFQTPKKPEKYFSSKKIKKSKKLKIIKKGGNEYPLIFATSSFDWSPDNQLFLSFDNRFVNSMGGNKTDINITIEQTKKWTMKVLDQYSKDNVEQVFPNRVPESMKKANKRQVESLIEMDATSIWANLPRSDNLGIGFANIVKSNTEKKQKKSKKISKENQNEQTVFNINQISDRPEKGINKAKSDSKSSSNSDKFEFLKKIWQSQSTNLVKQNMFLEQVNNTCYNLRYKKK